MVVEVPAKLGERRPRSPAEEYAGLLEGFYRDLLDMGIPANLARLVQRLERATGAAGASRKRALVIEPDETSRDAAILLLRETGLDVAGCAQASEALDYLRMRGNDTAFVFCDEVLAEGRDGVELVEMITILWPGIHVVLTADEGVDPPPGVVRLLKPWRAVDLLGQATRALRATPLKL